MPRFNFSTASQLTATYTGIVSTKRWRRAGAIVGRDPKRSASWSLVVHAYVLLSASVVMGIFISSASARSRYSAVMRFRRMADRKPLATSSRWSVGTIVAAFAFLMRAAGPP